MTGRVHARRSGVVGWLLGRVGIADSFGPLEARTMMYAVGPDHTPVHEWLSSQAAALYQEEFGRSAIGSVGTIADLERGARTEDEGVNPTSHFWDRYANFTRDWNDGISWFGSAPARALGFLTSLEGRGNQLDADSIVELGKMIHLVQDMTVPAHVHADAHVEVLGISPDPDPFHDWVDGAAFSSSVFNVHRAAFTDPARVRHTSYYRPGNIDPSTLRAPNDIAAGGWREAFRALFVENATSSERFDSDDYNGRIDRGGRRNAIPLIGTSWYSSWERHELEEIAREMIPLAVRSSAEFFRIFFAATERSLAESPSTELPPNSFRHAAQPHLGFRNLTSTDELHPQVVSSDVISLGAVATDEGFGDSGIGKSTFRYEYERRDAADPAAPWSATTRIAPSSIIPGAHLDDLSVAAPSSPEFANKRGASVAYELRAEEGFVYRVRVYVTDGAGHEGFSEDHYVQIGEGGGAVVEVIDRSGSMSGSPLDGAKNAASLFADLMQPGNRLGVVAFDSSANVLFPLTEVDANGQTIAGARSVIAGIVAGGSTAIGEGLYQADLELDTVPDSPNRAIILLSDGESNSGRDPFSIIDSYVDADIRVYTIGLGSADETTLQGIASARGGRYFYASTHADLQAIYSEIFGSISNQDQTANQNLRIDPGTTQTTGVDVPGGSSATFGINWAGSDLDMEVVDPVGRVYARSPNTVRIETFDTLAAWSASGPWSANAALLTVPARNGSVNTYTLGSKERWAVPALGEPSLAFTNALTLVDPSDDVRIFLEASLNGTSWTVIRELADSDDAGNVDLAAYSGESVFLRFRARLSGDTAGFTWAVDNLAMSVRRIDAPGVEFVSRPTYEFFRIRNPMAGRWNVRVTAVDVPDNDYQYNLYGYNDPTPPSNPTLVVADAVVTEGGGGIVTARFPVSLDFASTRPVQLRYATSHVSTSDQEFVPGSGTFTLLPGVVTGHIEIPIRGDLVRELAETFTLTITSVLNAHCPDPVATGTVLDPGFREIGFGGKTLAVYTDGDGNRVTVGLSSGTGAVLFAGSGGNSHPIGIRVDSAGKSARVSVASRAPTRVGHVTSTAPLTAFEAPNVSVTGGVTLQAVNKLSLRDVDAREGIRILGGTKPKITLANVYSSTLVSSIPIASLTIIRWTGGAITAPGLGGFRASDTVKVDLSIAGNLDTVAVRGGVEEGTWSVTGACKSLSTGKVRDVDLSFGTLNSFKSLGLIRADINAAGPRVSMSTGDVADARIVIDGMLSSLRCGTWSDTDAIADRVVATSVGTITASGDFASDVFASLNISSLKAAGAIRGAFIQGTNVANVSAAALDDVIIAAGYSATDTRLAETAADFRVAGARIGSVRLTGRAPGSTFVNSLLSAPVMGTLSLGRLSNAQTPASCGISADAVQALTFSVDDAAPTTLRNLNAAGERQFAGMLLRTVD